MGEDKFSSGNIPVIMVEGKSLPEVWEKSLIRTWEEGVSVKTQFDRPNDPPSKDCTMIMVIKNPFKEPRIHRALPTGLEELEIYRQEVVLGIHDHWIGGHGWSYSYHDRLFNYPLGDASKLTKGGFCVGKPEYLNQIETVIKNLVKCYYTRRAQAITWDPEIDAEHHEPPCLQRIWVRILEDPKEGLVLNMNTDWRSRDAFKAAFMNIFALTDLQKIIAQEVSKRIGRPAKVGRYVDNSSSYHIYGSYFKDFEGFLKTIKTKTFEKRVYNSEFAETFFKEAREKIEKENNPLPNDQKKE